MNLKDVEEFSTGIANLVYAKPEEKQQVKDAIMKMIMVSCIEYSRDETFKEKIDWMAQNTHHGKL